MVFEAEQKKLLPLPDNPFPAIERQTVRVGKTPYIRFDLNDYSVPHTFVRQTVIVNATENEVSIESNHQVIATHTRSFDQGAQIEKEEHVAELSKQKQRAREGRGQNRLVKTIPNARAFLEAAANRGYPLNSTISTLLRYLKQYGVPELTAAIDEALMRDVPHVNSVRLSLDRRREEKRMPVPLAIPLSEDARVTNVIIKPHDLKNYDAIENKPETTE